tara:strand:+ start:342 stop:1982 length:1641 start_codon:yes stop_codon:yes gene_type:complete
MSILSEEKKKIFELFNQKKYTKVLKIYKKNKEFNQNEPEITKLVITSEVFQKNYFSAEQIILRFLKKFDTAEFNYLLGNILKLQSKFESAANAFQKAITLDNKFSEAYNNLANVQKRLDLIEDAIQNYKKSIDLNPNNLEANYNFANLLKDKKQYNEALKKYEKVLKINPSFPDVYNNIGTIYSILGKFDECRYYFVKSIKLNKYFAEPYKNYVQATKINSNDKIFHLLKDILIEKNLSEDQKEIFYYSISKAYFDTGEDNLAFNNLKLANDLKLKKMNYSKKLQNKEFKEIKEFFTNHSDAKEKNNDDNKTIPIFILGMPRSGTSLLEQIISNHSKVFGGGELNFLPEAVDASGWRNDRNLKDITKYIRKKYYKNLETISKKNFVTDKLPGNFKRIGFIINALPESKIIHLERSPMAVCWSNYKSNFNSDGMAFTLNQENIAEYYLSYRNLMNYWYEKYAEKIITINYEKLVNNFEKEVKDLFVKLDLKWEKQLYEFHKNDRPVETASFMQVRSKIYKNSSEQWKKYKQYLKPMTDILSRNGIKF